MDTVSGIVILILGLTIGYAISYYIPYWRLKYEAKERECLELETENSELVNRITFKIKDGADYLEQVKELKGQLLHYREKTKYVDVYKNMVISMLQVLPNQEIFIPSVVYMTLEFERWELVEESDRKNNGTNLYLKEDKKWKNENS